MQSVYVCVDKKCHFNAHFLPCTVPNMTIKVTSKGSDHLANELRTPNEGINQRYLKNWADVADKICCRHT